MIFQLLLAADWPHCCSPISLSTSSPLSNDSSTKLSKRASQNEESQLLHKWIQFRVAMQILNMSSTPVAGQRTSEKALKGIIPSQMEVEHICWTHIQPIDPHSKLGYEPVSRDLESFFVKTTNVGLQEAQYPQFLLPWTMAHIFLGPPGPPIWL